MMFFIFRMIVWLDFWLLIFTHKVVRFLVEWISVTQVQIERGLMLAYIVFIMASYAGRHWWLGVILIVSNAYWVWQWHRVPDARRARQMFEPILGVVRLLIAVFLLGLALTFLLEPPRRWADVFFLLGQMCMVALLYVTSLPSGGDRGSKRKLAMDKLKDLFGTSWIPQPLPPLSRQAGFVDPANRLALFSQYETHPCGDEGDSPASV
jgi:hypothetical protein